MSVGAYTSWVTSEFFPWLHLSVFGSIIVILYSLREAKNKLVCYWSVGLLVVVGVVYRLPLVLFPETLSGNDPEKYALRAQIALHAGDYRLSDSDFYGIAGGFHTYIAQASSVTGLETLDAMVIIGLVFGIWAPVTAAAIAAIILDRTYQAQQAMIIAAAIGVVAPIGIRMSQVPIAQSIGTIIFVTFILAIISYLKTPASWGNYVPLDTAFEEINNQVDEIDRDIVSSRMKSWRKTRMVYNILILVLIFGMMLTHKMPLIIATAILGGIWIGTKVSASNTFWPFKPLRKTIPIGLVGLSVLATLIQQTIITDFITQALFLSQQTIESDSRIPTRVGDHPIAATPPDIGALFIFGSHSHIPAILLLAGITWLIVVWFTFISDADLARSSSVALLVSIAGLTAVVVVSLGGLASSGGAPPFRIHALVEVLLAALIGIGVALIGWGKQSSKYRKVGVMVAVLCLLPFLLFSVAAAPDFPGEQREYITAGEIDGKEFAVDYVNTDVYTDDRLQRETPYRNEVTDESDQWNRLGGNPYGTQFSVNNIELVNADDELFDRPAVLYRPNEDTYRVGGLYQDYRYQLTWDVEKSFETRSHKTYDNRNTIIYTNTDQ